MPKPNSPTPAGPNSGPRQPSGPSSQLFSFEDPSSQLAPEAKDRLINAINQVFGLLRVNYHNQFLKAYPDLDTLNQGKRLWMKLLAQHKPETILWAAEQVMKASEYLPSIAEITRRLETHQSLALGLPSPHAAFVEACRAPSPKSSFDWSHPAVYLAGKATDWYFLATQPEKLTYPVFEANYQILCERVAAGESLDRPIPTRLPKTASQPEPSREEKQAHLLAFRKEMRL